MDKYNGDTTKHVSLFEPLTLVLILATGIFGAIIGLQLIVSLGITANTSIIGALIAMAVARLPISICRRFRNVHRQNFIQTSISGATFGAANSLLIPIGIPYLMGKPELVMPMLIGAGVAMIVDATILYRMFDSKVFPASGAWPPGVATAEAIIAGDQGGKRARLLGYGVAGGVLGSYLGIPMSAFGVAFIGNIWALTMFGIGLLLRGYSISLFEIDINKLYIPHGIMIGAGLVALIQVTLVIFRKKKEEVARSESAAAKEYSFTRTEKDAQQTLVYGAAAYIIISVLIAFFGGIYAEMSLGMLLLYLIYAAFAAYVHEIIVGIAAMHSGWFPAFAVALITLVIGILIGFPPVALALLVGFSAATGPAFADMAYDLKTGYILRGYGKDTEFEMTGRRHQFYAELIGFAIAFVTVLLSYKLYFAQNLFPPVDRVYAATIKAGVSSDIARQLFLWAIPGAIIQLLGGPERQMGVLLATGLLILNPKAGWAVLTAILIRTIILKVKGKEAETPMSIVAAGIIAGDALYSFFSSLYKYKKL